jgi:hypothetical protein
MRKFAKKTRKVTILFRNPLGTFWKHIGNNFLNPTPPHPLQRKIRVLAAL